MKRMLCLTATLLVAIGIGVAGTPTAYAVPPTTRTFVLEGTQPLADCGDFLVLDQYDVEIVQTNFFDQDGVRVAIQQRIHGTDTYINSVTGESITMPTNFTVHFDTQALQNMSTGMVYRLTVPGLGAVLLNVGRSVYDFSEHEFVVLDGPHQVVEGDTSELCQPLAQ